MSQLHDSARPEASTTDRPTGSTRTAAFAAEAMSARDPFAAVE